MNDNELKPAATPQEIPLTEKGEPASNDSRQKYYGIQRQDNFQQIPNPLLCDVAAKKLLPFDILVYAVFQSHMGQKDSAWPSNKTVAKSVGRSVRCVQDSIARLDKCGHIERATKTQYGTYHTRILTDIKDGKVVSKARKGVKKSRKSGRVVNPVVPIVIWGDPDGVILADKSDEANKQVSPHLDLGVSELKVETVDGLDTDTELRLNKYADLHEANQEEEGEKDIPF